MTTIFRVDEPEKFYTPPPETFLLNYRGSVAHNMYVPKNDPKHIDDIDLIGFCFAPPEHYLGLTDWGSRGTKEIKDDPYDVVLYEIRKAFSLLLQGNPNIMSVLWTHPAHQIVKTDFSKRLLENKHLFLGKHVHAAFAGYAHSQLTRMESREPAEIREYLGVTAELKRRGEHPNHRGEMIEAPADHPAHFAEWGDDKLFARLVSFQKKGENLGYLGDKRKQLVLEHGYDSKNAAHLIRLLRMCIEFMETGEMIVYRVSDREELLAIKRGDWKLEDIKSLAVDLFEKARVARDKSSLPVGPARKEVEKLLVEILRENLK